MGTAGSHVQTEMFTQDSGVMVSAREQATLFSTDANLVMTPNQGRFATTANGKRTRHMGATNQHLFDLLPLLIPHQVYRTFSTVKEWQFLALTAGTAETAAVQPTGFKAYILGPHAATHVVIELHLQRGNVHLRRRRCLYWRLASRPAVRMGKAHIQQQGLVRRRMGR